VITPQSKLKVSLAQRGQENTAWYSYRWF